MKRTLGSIICAVLLGTAILTGCSGSGTTHESSSAATTEAAPSYADQDFMNNLSKGLITRWDISDELTQKVAEGTVTMESSEYKQGLVDCVNAELEAISGYKTGLFKDGNLQVLAISYINALERQLAALEDYPTEAYEKEWETAYDERTKLLSQLVSDYNLTVDEAHQAYLDEFKAKGKQVQMKEQYQSQVDDLLASIEFEETNDEYGYREYTAVVENTTDLDFIHFSIDINLMDEDGVLLGTQYASFDNWNSGVKARFQFSTDEDFATTEIFPNYIEDSNGVSYNGK